MDADLEALVEKLKGNYLDAIIDDIELELRLGEVADVQLRRDERREELDDGSHRQMLERGLDSIMARRVT